MLWPSTGAWQLHAESCADPPNHSPISGMQQYIGAQCKLLQPLSTTHTWCQGWGQAGTEGNSCWLPCRNLEPIISLPGGESLHGFILVTLLVEKAAVPGIKVGCCKPHSHLTPQVFRAHLSPSLHALLLCSLQATIQAIHALQHLDDECLHRALQGLAAAIGDMDKALQQMHGTRNGCTVTALSGLIGCTV